MFTWVLALSLTVAASELKVETIVLRSGHAVTGEVLKEKSDFLVVDIGYDVLKIPKQQITRRGSATDQPNLESGRKYGESGHLYATRDLPLANVRQLVDQFGEAVVLVKTTGGLGSGFIIDEAGHCITNYHVVEGETRISVDLFEKRNGAFVENTIEDVEIVALNPFYDLALLKIPNKNDRKFSRVYLGNSEDIRQGEPAFALGNPEGLTRSVTQGIISNTNRSMNGQLFIQTTAQINPGNSGGPLFNLRGQVIGVTNMKRIFSEGLGFAIPVDYVKDFLKNRDAFAYNKSNPNSGYRYLDPPRRQFWGDASREE